ncbi:hypothetical protein KGP36_06420 [Patescibacteria group bacterium]|nr:hypothetical protein [Patescibacteria group bacterium]
MDNSLANSPVGLTSRKIAFALVEEVSGKDWRDRDIDKLQEAFAEFGDAIVRQIVKAVLIIGEDNDSN